MIQLFLQNGDVARSNWIANFEKSRCRNVEIHPGCKLQSCIVASEINVRFTTVETNFRTLDNL